MDAGDARRACVSAGRAFERAHENRLGTKSRPAFRVVEWRQLGNGEGGPAVLEPAAVPAIGKPVPRVTGDEALDDGIPF